ncbi:putative regulator of flagella formation [Fictibacillus macauensis ZFHKF-1]|uniref:Putative regulator of flagella formation n=1 Tax=Fictibacillus macauensis ZFHKF-1 TaxID=1196324 RepID=I8ALX3_9BACL|nr:TIGR03826 family flagellar region protein [Fictibacillus macauensis]EIT86937.1 putative regulator of flagella formation [Fictibacillus macauensis ZFHKF-1]
MGELENCLQCHALFVYNGRKICQNCYANEEKDYDAVFHFMRQQKNRQATLHDIHTHTGVEERKIMNFLRQGRLHIVQFPQLYYECDTCLGPIREGRICKVCSVKMKKELENTAATVVNKKHKLGTSYYTDC